MNSFGWQEKIAACFLRFIFPNIYQFCQKVFLCLGCLYVPGPITVSKKVEYYNVSRTGPLGHCCDHGIGTYNQKEEHARIAARNGSHTLSNAAVQGTLIYSGA